MGLFRRNKNKKDKKSKKEDVREGPPPQQQPQGDYAESAVQSTPRVATGELDGMVTVPKDSKDPDGDKSVARETKPPYFSPPPAREAAFQGPPRFDWIDIETAAATKIQSMHRRNIVMTELEAQGKSTSAIRNRKRRLKAHVGGSHPVQTQDTPSLFACCAVGLAFGDATEEDDIAYRNFQKKQYKERQKQQAMHELALRRQYLREHGAGVGNVQESVEVVE